MVELAIVFYCLVQDDFRETALVAAVNEGHVHDAEILVKNGADVNYRNKVKALIPVKQVCIMCPMIRHDIMVNQWDVSNKYAACAIHGRHAYVLVPPLDTNKILCLYPIYRYNCDPPRQNQPYCAGYQSEIQ